MINWVCWFNVPVFNVGDLIVSEMMGPGVILVQAKQNEKKHKTDLWNDKNELKTARQNRKEKTTRSKM